MYKTLVLILFPISSTEKVINIKYAVRMKLLFFLYNKD